MLETRACPSTEMQTVTFLQDLAVVMIAAGLVTVAFHRLKLPVVLGYILAGTIVGPHLTPFPLIRDQPTIRTLADLGVVFLMFSLGLEFSIRRLRRVGPTALIAGALEILLMNWLGYEMGRLFGWKPMDRLFLGAMLSISSTTIIVKALAELGRSKENFAELIFGILIVEDVLAIVMIALLSGIAMTGRFEAGHLVSTVARLAAFLAVAVVAGLLGVPRLVGYVARFKSNEMLLITVLALCFGVSLLAVKLRYSVALGAFVIGAVIAEAREIGRIEALTEPLRDMFCAVFFVAIGLQIDPAILVEHALPVAGLVLAVIVGKAVACTFGSFVAGNDTRTALRVGLGMTQIGEFSFIIASLGLALGVISDFLYPVAVTVSAFTTLTTPWLIRSTDRFVNWFDRTAPRRFVNYLAVYTHWAGQWRETRHRSMANRLIRKWVGQMLLNLLLVAGIFMAAVFAGQRRPGWFGRLQVESEDLKAGLWLAAMLLSLPLLIAVYRKLQALGLLVGELARQRLAGADPRVHAVQTLVANTVQFAGVVAVALVLLVLGSAVLPSTRKLLLLLVVIAGVAFLLWRSFIRVYSKVQYALEETLAQPPPSRAPEVPPALGGLLKQAELEQLELPAASFAVGQLIRQLALRTRTGASVVAIERPGATIVNPGPDEELAANDRLLLLGTRRQLDQARAYLAAPSSGSAS